MVHSSFTGRRRDIDGRGRFGSRHAGACDYDGDGKVDVAFYRDGMWVILRSSDGVASVVGWGGLPGDVVVPGDYDGDGKADQAVYRGGTWFILRSLDGGCRRRVGADWRRTYLCPRTMMAMDERT